MCTGVCLYWLEGPEFSLSFTPAILFNHCPFLLPHGEDVQKVLDQWKEYKMGVPTYGAIILDETLDNVSKRPYDDALWKYFPL